MERWGLILGVIPTARAALQKLLSNVCIKAEPQAERYKYTMLTD